MKHILCFGDSNTYGLIPGNKGRFTWEERWTGRVQQLLGYKRYRIIEEGLCGRTSKFSEERRGRNGGNELPILLETHAPVDQIIIMLGTNDCKTRFGATALEIGKGIEQLIIEVRLHNPKTEILIVSPIELGERVWEEGFDPEFSKESVNVSRGLKQVYQQIAEKHQCNFLAASDYASPSKDDEEHLDIAGHERLANMIYQKIQEERGFAAAV